LKAGAAGYLNKDCPPEELTKAINIAMLGKKYITASIADQLLLSLDKDGDKPAHESLSSREFEVMKLLGSGKSVSEIADQMSLSVTTVSTYRARIMEKMSITSNAQITIYCIENKLI
jgi:DNA-binding NarL/FixJ family response regulator